ncbi:hypothetical protein QNI19_14645 [Cytophagaceae bacterium DM2B3-1]|uniref:Uncharacterized protein n=1 Tax=Xanthocytophaga flava TaxID=3048013 RepID=A0ABT7CKA9_9BACT|nr:hypothetical protein [Xanthocytophaga flavus]MDJ1494179.1 hypothetical protein [Xanthocytophaga flavus]
MGKTEIEKMKAQAIAFIQKADDFILIAKKGIEVDFMANVSDNNEIMSNLMDSLEESLSESFRLAEEKKSIIDKSNPN